MVTVAKELASVVYDHSNGEIAKHCAAIIRECYENTSEERGERLIVCTSLVESGHAGEGGDIPPVIRVFGLDTEGQRVEWLDKYVIFSNDQLNCLCCADLCLCSSGLSYPPF